MQLDRYMKEKFPNLELCSPLFYNWPIGIRFELENNDLQSEKEYIEHVLARANSLYDALFDSSDEMYVVSNVYDQRLKKKGFFPSIVKNKKVLWSITSYPIINPYLDDDEPVEEKKANRMILKCRKKDLNKNLIRKYLDSEVAELFLININKELIYYIYDSRGSDLVSAKSETIQPYYEQFNDWILDYDREKIDKVFKDDN
ncbi:DUF3885 domain-containing protein [Alkalihalobacterium chitinilyticum]|uniref:DUF3885 domain-containing protein n=1 Tax=Alkalihalobacterium chitinilyticum TaxID=2980103 RepID=A0ABT5VLG7_9BACI|nr:DUF3885 domain-containing protein [Alkalihalobacterium chitinilyticum]MDE5416147.1 DUF3885 domain-containing protein [Alkalihalobacterium chitinilyticum]